MRHMKPTIQNHYRALITRAVGDVHQAQQLRRLCFGVGNADTDQDAFDDTYQHVLIYVGLHLSVYTSAKWRGCNADVQWRIL